MFEQTVQLVFPNFSIIWIVGSCSPADSRVPYCNCTFELIQFSLRLSTDVSSFGWGLLNHFSCSVPIRNYDIRFTFGSYHFNALCFCLRFGLGYLQLLILGCRLLALINSTTLVFLCNLDFGFSLNILTFAV